MHSSVTCFSNGYNILNIGKNKKKNKKKSRLKSNEEKKTQNNSKITEKEGKRKNHIYQILVGWNWIPSGKNEQQSCMLLTLEKSLLTDPFIDRWYVLVSVNRVN